MTHTRIAQARRSVGALVAAAMLTVPGLGSGVALADELSDATTLAPAPMIETELAPSPDGPMIGREHEQRGHDDGAHHAVRLVTDTMRVAREHEQRGHDDGPRHA